MQVVQTRPHADPLLGERAGASGLTLLALGLALLTGLTIGQLTLLGGGAFEKSSGHSTEATRTGLAFYDAIDAYLTAGQADQLQRLVHPDFVDHMDGQPATKGVEPLLRQLETLGAFVSKAHVTATPMSSSGNLVRFAVSIPPAAGDATILGLPVAQTEPTVFGDTLRISDGRVTERWSDLRLPIIATSLASIVWDPPPASQMLPAIERLTMLRGSTMTLKLGTAHVLVVESGALTITGTPRGAVSSVPEFPTDPADAEPIVALPGSTVVAASESPYRIANEGPAVATALLIRAAGHARSTDHPVLGVFGTSQNDVGVQVETLSEAIMLPSRKGAWRIEIGWVTLLPGTTIPAHEIAGTELIVVEQGELTAHLGPCERRCIQTVEGASTLTREQLPVRTGEGISASDGATSAYRVSGSAAAKLLIVTVAPA